MSEFKLTLDNEQPEFTPVVEEDGTPVLDLNDDNGGNDANAIRSTETAVTLCELLEKDLTPAQKNEIAAFVPKIKLTTEVVDTYGQDAQNELTSYTKRITAATKAQDLGDVGVCLATLVRDLEENDPSAVEFPVEPNENDFAGWFDKLTNAYEKAKAAFDAKYDAARDQVIARHSTAEELISKSESSLREHVVILGTDIKTYEQLEEKLKKFMVTLTMYILAGKRRLEIFHNEELPQLEMAAKDAGPSSHAEQVRADAVDNATYFDKQIYNLQISRELGAQALIMSRLIRNNARSLRQQINATLIHAINTWRTNMTLAIGVENAKRALSAQQSANDYTEKMMRQLTEKLGSATVEIARANEKGFIDINAVAQNHRTLMDTISKVMEIQAEGATTRKAAEASLASFELETRAKYKELMNAQSASTAS